MVGTCHEDVARLGLAEGEAVQSQPPRLPVGPPTLKAIRLRSIRPPCYSDSMGVFLTIWTIRLATLFYLAALARMVRGLVDADTLGVWTMALVLLVVHVLCAFGVYHEWSHQQAWDHTAAETEAIVGLEFGGGLYFNYALLLIWTADVAWWWARPASYLARSRWISLAIHGYLGFMFVNAVVVFEPGPFRWVGVVGMFGLLVLWYQHRSRQSANGDTGEQRNL